MVLKLAPKPTVEEELKTSAVKILREALELAEKGEITTVIIIMQNVDTNWHYDWSQTIKLSESIGRLEIIKQDWINQHFETEGEKLQKE